MESPQLGRTIPLFVGCRGRFECWIVIENAIERHIGGDWLYQSLRLVCVAQEIAAQIS